MELGGKALCQKRKTNDPPPDSRLSLRLSLPTAADDPTSNTQDDEFLADEGDFFSPTNSSRINVEDCPLYRMPHTR